MEEDNAEIGSGKELSPEKQIIFECWKRCAEAESQELTSGYWNVKFDKLGNAHKVWVSDTRKILINCIKALDRSIAKSNKDKQFNDAKEEIRKECDECFKRFGFPLFKVKKTLDEDSEYEDIYKYSKEYTGEYSMPQITPSTDKALVVDIDEDGKRYERDWTNNYENYMDSLVLIYGKLQEELIELLHRARIFESSSLLDKKKK